MAAGIYSPLRYPGGKARLASFLSSVLQANRLEDAIYVEPYAGGAGAALDLLYSEGVQSILINDADPRIHAFWRSITEQNEDFLELIEGARLNVTEWKRQREIYAAPSEYDTLSVGFATFYLNRTSRSGIIHNAGPIGGFNQTGNYKIDARFNRDGLIKRVRHIGMYSDRIDVTNLDGLALIRSLASADEPHFVYLDPPYFVKGGDLYLNQFTPDQHAELAKYFDEKYPHRWVMTYDNVSQISDLYKAHNQQTFDLTYSAYERRLGKELLIFPNYVTVPEGSKGLLRDAA